MSQCHGTNVGPVGELRRGNGGVTGGVPFVAFTNRSLVTGEKAEPVRAGSHGALPMVAFDRTQASVSGDIAGPLRACGAQAEGVNDGKADVQCIGFKWHASNTARSMGEIKEGTPPITDKQPGVVGSFGVRRLTPIECERLQGLPDGHTDGQSDTQRYRQLGNAVAEPCGEWIGYRIVGVEAGR